MLGRLREKGLTVKFMLHGRASGTGYAAAVEPTLMPSGSVEAAVPENYNIATLEGATIGTLKFYGQGAGGDPTGNAVVQDLLDIAQGCKDTPPRTGGALQLNYNQIAVPRRISGLLLPAGYSTFLYLLMDRS